MAPGPTGAIWNSRLSQVDAKPEQFAVPHDRAINDFRLTLSIDPDDKGARNNLNALGVAP